MGAIPWYGDDRRLPCGQQALSFSSGLATANLGPVRPGGDLTGLFTPFCESSSFVEDPCRDAIATLALEEKGAVQRSSIPPYQGGRGVYPVVAGPGRGGGVFTPITSWLPSALGGHGLNTYLCVSKFHMETLSSIIQGLHLGWWIVLLDLKDAYLHVLIHPSH